MFANILKKNKKNVAYSTLLNSIIGILLSILIIVFNFVRSSLTTYTYGLESLGLLTIILGILPYISSSHNGLTSVSFYNLYDSVYGLKKKNYKEINNKISNLRPQYYFFGIIYLSITLILAFAFPFFFNQSGTICLNNNIHNNDIQWYETTTFILSNAIEIISVYFIVPVSIILLFINKQSFIYNLINVFLTIILNVIIITLFVLVKNNIIHIDFIWMNVIVFCLLGSKMLFLTILLFPIRRKYFAWYKRQKPTSWKINKNNILSVVSQYFNQFSSDVFAILFIVYATVISNNQPVHEHISLFHNGDGINHNIGDEFSPSGVFSIFLMLITSSKEIVHCIIDAYIPSMAEHISKNNKKINQHFFHRYQMLTIFITSYTISTYLLTIPFSNSLFLESNNFNVWLAIGLCIPTFIDSLTSTYDHLLPIYGNFKRIMMLSILKALLIVCLLIIFSCSICLTNPSYVVDGLYISIICSWTITSIVLYFMSRFIVIKHINNDKCLNIFKQSSLSFVYIFILFTIALPVFIIFQEKINVNIAEWNIGIKVMIIVLIGFSNFFVNILNLYIFRRSDMMFYLKELNKKTNVKKVKSNLKK